MDFYSFCRYHVAYLRLILSESESCVTGAEMTKKTATELRCGITLCCCQDNHFCLLQDNRVCPVICTLFKLLGGEIYLAVLWYTFVDFILHIHLISHFCVPRLKILEPKWSQISIAIIIAFNLL